MTTAMDNGVMFSPTLNPADAVGLPATPVVIDQAGHAVEKESPTSAAAQITVLLVDDHVILRAGLRALLETQADFRLVGEAGTFEEALERATVLQPDIVLTDIGLPGRSGLLLIRELRKACPAARVVLLTAHASDEYIRAGLDARAEGYVLKDCSHAELSTAIRTVASGQQFLCDAVASRVLADYLNRATPRAAHVDPLQAVTTRERQLLTRIASGRSNKAMARELNLSVKTVEKHRANLMRKLSLHNAADITRFALNHHLVAQDSGDRFSAA